MACSTAQIHASADIAGTAAAVFAHWIDPKARLRFEAPPESGMRYKNFTPEAGGVEEIEIVHEGQVVGQMIQHLVVLDPPKLIVSQITGTFNGATTMAMQVVMHFEATERGTHIRATSQVVDTTGRDVTAEHKAGWQQMFEKFATDFAVHGPRA